MASPPLSRRRGLVIGSAHGCARALRGAGRHLSERMGRAARLAPPAGARRLGAMPLRPLLLALLLLAPPAAATEDEPGLRVGGSCGRDGRLVLARVQAERRSDGQWNILLHLRNTTRRTLAFTLSLKLGPREMARADNQPYRVEGGAVLVVPTGPAPAPVPTARVAEALVLHCPM